MSRQRIEDLGRIYERLNLVVDHEAFFPYIEQDFIKLMHNADLVEEKFNQLCALRNEIYEIRAIANGEDLLNQNAMC